MAENQADTLRHVAREPLEARFGVAQTSRGPVGQFLQHFPARGTGYGIDRLLDGLGADTDHGPVERARKIAGQANAAVARRVGFDVNQDRLVRHGDLPLKNAADSIAGLSRRPMT